MLDGNFINTKRCLVHSARHISKFRRYPPGDIPPLAQPAGPGPGTRSAGAMQWPDCCIPPVLMWAGCVDCMNHDSGGVGQTGDSCIVADTNSRANTIAILSFSAALGSRLESQAVPR